MRARHLMAGLLGAVAAASAAKQPTRHDDAEVRVMHALEQIRSGQLGAAGESLSTLIKARPDFRLAHYLFAELRAQRAGDALATGRHPGGEALLSEARQRWQHHRQPPPVGAVPDAILRLAPRHEYAIVADLAQNRLYLVRNDNGRARLEADFYASIGSAGPGKRSEGDQRTPVGIYHTTGFRPDRRLPELYGDGALTLNYPNAWDRRHGRTGHGIWLHGVPRATFNRSPRASEGCVVLANQDLNRLRERVRGEVTPVILTDDLQWLTPAQARQRRDTVLEAVARWQRERAPRDIDTQTTWQPLSALPELVPQSPIMQPHRSLRGQTANAPLDHISVFAYPGEPNLMMTTFTGTEGNAVETMPATLFWREGTDIGWRLVHASRS